MQYLAKLEKSMCCHESQVRQRPVLVAGCSRNKNADHWRKNELMSVVGKLQFFISPNRKSKKK